MSLQYNVVENKSFTKGEVTSFVCGPSNKTVVGRRFHGITNVKTKLDLQNLASVSFESFYLLLSFLPNAMSIHLSRKIVLLLFLMKMKFVLPYAVFGLLFSICRTSVSKLFINVLEILSTRTKKFVFWPSKETVQNCMSQVFKLYYPNIRIIVDYTENNTEMPKRIDRLFMYFNYNFLLLLSKLWIMAISIVNVRTNI